MLAAKKMAIIVSFFVSVGQLSFDRRSYCGRSSRMQGLLNRKTIFKRSARARSSFGLFSKNHYETYHNNITPIRVTQP